VRLHGYEQGENKLKLDMDSKHIINVGSVGQPRDRDNRACYLMFDEEKKLLEWRRVIYDIMKYCRRLCSTVRRTRPKCPPINNRRNASEAKT
jgi:diadenosine tetraphosphatase ApaH/serine/threonine PP2A family protein phosphatase